MFPDVKFDSYISRRDIRAPGGILISPYGWSVSPNGIRAQPRLCQHNTQGPGAFSEPGRRFKHHRARNLRTNRAMDQPQTKRPRRTCNQAAGSKEGRKRQREQVEHSESCLSESGNESCSSDEDDLWRLWDGSVTDDEGGSGMEAYDDHNLHTSCDHCEVIVPAAESMELEAEFEK